MQGREFLDLARELARGSAERHLRGAAGRAYYSLMLECRDALDSWGFSLPARETVHAFVRLRFTRPRDTDLNTIGLALERSLRLRVEADYELTLTGSFRNGSLTHQIIPVVAQALVTLDRIDNDSILRTNAIAAIRAAFP